MPAELFPAFIKLENRRCLVVGAGAIATSKIASLLRAGAHITVVAPASQIRSRRTRCRRKNHLAPPRISRSRSRRHFSRHRRNFRQFGESRRLSSSRKSAAFSATPSTTHLTAIFISPPSFAAAISKSQSQPRAKAPPSPSAFAAKSMALSTNTLSATGCISSARSGGTSWPRSNSASDERKKLLNLLAYSEICNRKFEIDSHKPNSRAIEFVWPRTCMLQTTSRIMRANRSTLQPIIDSGAIMKTASNGKVYLSRRGPRRSRTPHRESPRADPRRERDSPRRSRLRADSCARESSSDGRQCRKTLRHEKYHPARNQSPDDRLARRGLSVVRLKSGDPGIFGRLAEERDALESSRHPL